MINAHSAFNTTACLLNIVKEPENWITQLFVFILSGGG